MVDIRRIDVVQCGNEIGIALLEDAPHGVARIVDLAFGGCRGLARRAIADQPGLEIGEIGEFLPAQYLARHEDRWSPAGIEGQIALLRIARRELDQIGVETVGEFEDQRVIGKCPIVHTSGATSRLGSGVTSAIAEDFAIAARIVSRDRLEAAGILRLQYLERIGGQHLSARLAGSFTSSGVANRVVISVMTWALFSSSTLGIQISLLGVENTLSTKASLRCPWPA